MAFCSTGMLSRKIYVARNKHIAGIAATFRHSLRKKTPAAGSELNQFARNKFIGELT